MCACQSEDRAVDVVIGLGAGRTGVRIPAGVRDFSRTIQIDPGLSHRAPEFFAGGVKRPGRDLDHSPSSSAKVRSEWSCTSFPPIRLHGTEGKNVFTLPVGLSGAGMI